MYSSNGFYNQQEINTGRSTKTGKKRMTIKTRYLLFFEFISFISNIRAQVLEQIEQGLQFRVS